MTAAAAPLAADLEVALRRLGHGPASTVYECEDCGVRAVGSQRCEECLRFMRRVGMGGTCPTCDEPVTVAELMGAGPTARPGGIRP